MGEFNDRTSHSTHEEYTNASTHPRHEFSARGGNTSESSTDSAEPTLPAKGDLPTPLGQNDVMVPSPITAEFTSAEVEESYRVYKEAVQMGLVPTDADHETMINTATK